MRKKLTPRSGIKTLTKAEAIAAKALARFRPTRKQVRSFVLIGSNGKPLPAKTSRKGVMVYVYRSSKRGHRVKFRPVKERRRKPIVPRSPDSYDLPSQRGPKTALDKFYAGRRTHTRPVRTMRQTPREKRSGINYLRFTRQLSRDIRQFSGSFRSHGSFLIEVSFTVRLPSGKLESHDVTIGFRQTETQHLSPAAVETFVRRKVYAFIADQLSRHDQVSAGSAAHIRSLKANRGSLRDEWVDRIGQPWDKQDFEVVRIVQMSYKLSKVS